MGSIRFLNADLKVVLATNAGGEQYTRSFGFAIGAYEKATGKKYNFKENLPKEYFLSPEPVLSLVKDSGIYLMAAKVGVDQIKLPMAERTDLIYAVGFNPEKDEDVWERAVEAVGGDDFVEDIKVSHLEKWVGMGMDIIFTISSSRMSIKAVPPKKTRARVKS